MTKDELFARAANRDAMTFEELKALPNDGIKKFYLIKNFGGEIASLAARPSLKVHGCDQLVAMIEAARNR